MLLVLGEAEAASGHREQMLEAVGVLTAATAADDGCEQYGFYADVTRPDVFVSLEVWRDQAALDAHMDHAHTQAFLAAVPDLVVGTPTMQLLHVEPAQEETR